MTSRKVRQTFERHIIDIELIFRLYKDLQVGRKHQTSKRKMSKLLEQAFHKRRGNPLNGH